MIRDPETLEGVGRRWGPLRGRNLETQSEGPMSREVARGWIPDTPGSRLPARPDSGERGNRAPEPPLSAHLEGEAKQKVGESGGRTPGS